jgi:hypothetical protein
MTFRDVYGPPFRWFAWYPVWTDDRGWRWLQHVNRRRFYLDRNGRPAMSWWTHLTGASR